MIVFQPNPWTETELDWTAKGPSWKGQYAAVEGSRRQQRFPRHSAVQFSSGHKPSPALALFVLSWFVDSSTSWQHCKSVSVGQLNWSWQANWQRNKAKINKKSKEKQISTADSKGSGKQPERMWLEGAKGSIYKGEIDRERRREREMERELWQWEIVFTLSPLLILAWICLSII